MKIELDKSKPYSSMYRIPCNKDSCVGSAFFRWHGEKVFIWCVSCLELGFSFNTIEEALAGWYIHGLSMVIVLEDKEI
jgi:hypothetical protein